MRAAVSIAPAERLSDDSNAAPLGLRSSLNIQQAGLVERTLTITDAKWNSRLVLIKPSLSRCGMSLSAMRCPTFPGFSAFLLLLLEEDFFFFFFFPKYLSLSSPTRTNHLPQMPEQDV